MKKGFLLIFAFSMIPVFFISCEHDFLNPADPGADNYQGYQVYDEDSVPEGETLTITEMYPIDNVDDITDTTPIFNWSEVTNADTYQFQITSVKVDISDAEIISVSDSEYQLPMESKLQYNTTYYWRVRAVLGENMYSPWSEVKNITPEWNIIWTGLIPADTGTSVDTTPLVEWDAVTNASSYELVYSDSAEELDLSEIKSVTFNQYQIDDAYAFGTNLFWKIRAINEDGVHSDWSSIKSFDIDLNLNLTGITPEHNSSTSDTTPLIQWDSIAGATGYKIKYANNTADLNSADIHEISTSSFQIETVQNLDNVIYWQIAVINPDNITTDWSTVHNFTIAWTVTYSGINPANNETTEDTTPTILWNGVSQASSYVIRYSSSAGNLSTATQYETDFTCYQIIDVFNFGETLYWQIRAKNADGVEAAWSSVYYFNFDWDISWVDRTPANGSQTTDTTPLLEWADVIDANKYRIRYSTDPLLLDSATENETTNSEFLIPEVIELNNNIYWQLSAINQDDVQSDWSEVFSFLIEWDFSWEGIAPGTDVFTIDNTPTISWNAIDGADTYNISYWDEAEGESYSTDVVSNSNAYTLEQFDIGTSIQWKVQAVNIDNVTSDWSNTFRIEIIKEIAIDGLVGEWLFDYNLEDTSDNTNDFISHNTVFTEDRFGKSNSCVSFDGIDSYLYSNPIFLDYETGTTISLWVYVIGDGNSSNQSWILMNDFNTPEFGFYIDETINRFELGINQGAYFEIYTFTPVVYNTQWYHIVFTITEPGFMSYYINGSYISGAEVPNTTGGGQIFGVILGNWGISDYTNCYEGYIDDVRIYDVKLTSEEILDLYHEKNW